MLGDAGYLPNYPMDSYEFYEGKRPQRGPLAEILNVNSNCRLSFAHIKFKCIWTLPGRREIEQ